MKLQPAVLLTAFAMLTSLIGVESMAAAGEPILFGIESENNEFSGDEENRGFKLAFREANDAGGVGGHKLAWTDRKASFDPPSRLARAHDFVEKDHVFALINLGGVALELAEYTEKVRVPYLFPHNGRLDNSKYHYLFTSYPGYTDETQIMFAYLPRELGLRRLAIIHAADGYGELFRHALELGAAHDGYVYTGAVAISSREPVDLSRELQRLIDTHADGIIMALYPEQAQALMEAKSKVGWKGRLIATGPLTDEQALVRQDGSSEGTMGFCYYPDPERSTESGVVAYRAAIARYEPGGPVNRYSLYGYVYGKLIIEGLRRTGATLTRDRFVSAMETIQDWSSGGIMPNVTFSRTQHHAQPAGFICELSGGRFKPLSGWISDAKSPPK